MTASIFQLLFWNIWIENSWYSLVFCYCIVVATVHRLTPHQFSLDPKRNFIGFWLCNPIMFSLRLFYLKFTCMHLIAWKWFSAPLRFQDLRKLLHFSITCCKWCTFQFSIRLFGIEVESFLFFIYLPSLSPFFPHFSLSLTNASQKFK